MKRRKNKEIEIVQLFSEEKLNEFKDMPVRTRLLWLEKANTFVNRVLGLKKRALFDERFKGLKLK
jgi:hypothetical protein